jgi:predicted SnoaL-like aldol condensation-catalyzing enzyme
MQRGRAAFALALGLLATLPQAGATQAATPCSGTAAENRALVVRFYETALVQRQVRRGFETFVSPDFIEHKPDVASGDREGAIGMLEGLIRELPEARWEILRAVAADDMVAIHARATLVPGQPPYAIADFFRVAGCRIVEHWDVVAGPVEGARNPHPRF